MLLICTFVVLFNKIDRMKNKKSYRSPDFAKYVVTYLLDLKEEAAQAKEEKMALRNMLKSGDLTQDEKSELKISFMQAKILHKALKAVYLQAKKELGYYTDGGQDSEEYDLEGIRAMFQSLPEEEVFLIEQNEVIKPAAKVKSITPAKRGRKPAVQNTAKPEATVKPAAKSTAKAEVAGIATTKRGRKPADKPVAKVKQESTANKGRKPAAQSPAKEVVSAQPAAKRGRKAGPKPLAEVKPAAPAKRGRKAGPKPLAEVKPTAPAKRGRKAGPKPLAEVKPTAPAKRGRKPAVKTAEMRKPAAPGKKRGPKPKIK